MSLLLISFSDHCFAQETIITFDTPTRQSGQLFVFGNKYLLIGGTNQVDDENVYMSLLNENLEIIWSRSYSTEAVDRPWNVIKLDNDNFLVSTGSGGETHHLLEIDQDGQLIKSQTATSTNNRLESLLSTEDDGFIYYGELILEELGGAVPAMIKYDKELKVEWSYYYDHTLADGVREGYQVKTRNAIQLPDGSFMILCSYFNPADSFTDQRALLIKTDENGVQQWVRGYHGGGWDFPIKIKQTLDGGFIMLSRSNSYSEQLEILLTKVDFSGESQWTKTYGRNRELNAFDILQLPDGDFMLCGNTGNFDDDGTSALMLRLDVEGAIESAILYDLDDLNVTNKIVLAPDGSVLLSGQVSNDDFSVVRALVIQLQSLDVAAKSCGLNATGLINERSVNTGTFSVSYSQTAFDYQLANVEMTENTLNLEREIISCQGCPLGFTEQRFICPGSTVELDASFAGGISYLWEDQTTESRFLADKPGVYWVNITDSEGCTYRNYFQVDEFNKSANMVDQQFVCQDQTLLLDASAHGAQSYSWQDGSNSTTFLANQAGIYWVDIVTPECSYRDSVEVAVVPSETLDIGEDKLLCKGDTVVLDASTPSALSYQWQDGSTASTLRVGQPGTYTVSVDTRCEVLTDLVEIVEPQKISIPNVFTPNNDGKNDFFELVPLTSDYDVTIVDRSGKQVYSAISYDNTWDGGNLGAGVYYYLITNQCSGEELKGWVQLIR